MQEQADIHWHCEDGCEKADFVERDGVLVCIRCGANAINVPDCVCQQFHRELFSAAIKRMKATGELRIIEVGPKRKTASNWIPLIMTIGPVVGAILGFVAWNVVEMWMHDVSIYDAMFIESWKSR